MTNERAREILGYMSRRLEADELKAVNTALEALNENNVQSHSEEHILEECIHMMHGLVDDFAEWYKWIHGEDAIENLDDEEKFCVRKTYFSIVQKLFLWGTTHSGGTSTREKCHELGVKDWSEYIEFCFEEEEE